MDILTPFVMGCLLWLAWHDLKTREITETPVCLLGVFGMLWHVLQGTWGHGLLWGLAYGLMGNSLYWGQFWGFGDVIVFVLVGFVAGGRLNHARFIGLLLFFGMVFEFFYRRVAKLPLYRMVKLSELRAEDWVTERITHIDDVIVLGTEPGLSEGQINNIKMLLETGALENREVKVKEGVPLIPVFPWAFIASVSF